MYHTLYLTVAAFCHWPSKKWKNVINMLVNPYHHSLFTNTQTLTMYGIQYIFIIEIVSIHLQKCIDKKNSNRNMLPNSNVECCVHILSKILNAFYFLTLYACMYSKICICIEHFDSYYMFVWLYPYRSSKDVCTIILYLIMTAQI